MLENEAVKLSLVIPVYNEEKSIDAFMEKTLQALESIPHLDLEFVFVNDGSFDTTLQLLRQFQQRAAVCIKIVDLSRNFGKEAALSAGLDVATGQVVVPIDVDLQDPPEVIPFMLERWREGYDVVLGHRASRASDSFMKRTTAALFYRLHNQISEPRLPENVGDFRLMDRCVVDALKKLPESCRFMKGLFAWLGFRTVSIDYVRLKRTSGKSKFNGWKLWNFAVEGITSFSTMPLRFWTYTGLLVSLMAFFYAFIIILRVLILGVDIPGYASILVSIFFLGGLQLIGIGVLGEYLGRAYIESKNRPVYIVRKIYTPDDAAKKTESTH